MGAGSLATTVSQPHSIPKWRAGYCHVGNPPAAGVLARRGLKPTGYIPLFRRLSSAHSILQLAAMVLPPKCHGVM
ncbi:unannotated protein [freshwater metagenome]|uniref:Unannotated protein n=1 Tax=freshwater metagenome TaxID=449393 RepID=A0A6J7QQF3_9ZZZZ